MNNLKKNSISINKIKIGMSASIKKIIKLDDIKLFAKLSGDTNPIHLDQKYAASSMYKKNIAHGLMSSSFFSGIFGTQLPGEGSIYTYQSLKFKRPIYIGDEVEAKVVVIDIDANKKRIKFTTQCIVNSKICIDGEAEILIP
tara:strand:+ start:22258 stop:22683 length:426 start_codon:yes stop_codon:yes gene_type:complete